MITPCHETSTQEMPIQTIRFTVGTCMSLGTCRQYVAGHFGDSAGQRGTVVGGAAPFDLSSDDPAKGKQGGGVVQFMETSTATLAFPFTSTKRPSKRKSGER